MDSLSPSLPLVSICIPAFNSEKWIAQCLDSALSQNYSPLEIIVSDDCSTDKTTEVVRCYERYGVRLVQPIKNLGRYGNQNVAMNAGKGEFLLKLDADDWISPLYLNELLPMMLAHPNVAFATCNFEIVDTGGRRISSERRIWPLGARQGRKEFYRYIQGPKAKGSCVLFRRRHFEMVGGCDERFIYAGDWWLFIKLLLIGDVYYSNKSLASYRVHSVGKSDLLLWQVQDWLLALQLLPNLWPPDLPGRDRYIRIARSAFARMAINSIPNARPDLRSQLLDLTFKIDRSWPTRQMAKLANTSLSPILSYPKHIRRVMTRLIKDYLW